MGPIRCPETSVTNYQSELRNAPEERRSQLTENLFTLMGSVKVKFTFQYKELTSRRVLQTLNSHVTIHSTLPFIQAAEISCPLTDRHFEVAYCVQICEHIK